MSRRGSLGAAGFGLAAGLVLAVDLPGSPVPDAVHEAAFAAPLAPVPTPVVVPFAFGAQEQAQAGRSGLTLAFPAGSVTTSGGSAGPAVATAARPYGRRDTSGLTGSGIPLRVARAYQAAAAAIARTDPSCHLNWTLLAGIGRVETDHGRFGGSAVRADGVVSPSILGLRLDGARAGTARIGDSDGGRLDGDPAFDRAVGPMQFLPGTWRTVGADGDGDGTADPQDVDDAALAAARYLCAGGSDLGTTDGRWAAVLRYNHSDSYVSTVLALADAYASGHTAVFPTRPVMVPEPPGDSESASPVRADPPPSSPPAPSAAPTSSARPTVSPTPTGRPTPTVTPTGTPTTTATGTPTASPTSTPSCPTATSSATETATNAPTAIPTATPTADPTAAPTTSPTTPPQPCANPDETVETGKGEPAEAVTRATIAP